MLEDAPAVVRRYFELDPEALGADRYQVRGRLTGSFPGGTADLRWEFTLTGELIGRLVIAP